MAREISHPVLQPDQTREHAAKSVIYFKPYIAIYKSCGYRLLDFEPITQKHFETIFAS
jgi:hypothetical protein